MMKFQQNDVCSMTIADLTRKTVHQASDTLRLFFAQPQPMQFPIQITISLLGFSFSKSSDNKSKKHQVCASPFCLFTYWQRMD